MTPQPKTLRFGSVCVAGNLNIDLIIRQVPHLPQWGQEVIGSSHIAVSSGQGGYLALGLARLGTPTGVIGSLGRDAFGQQILDDLQAFGAETRHIEIQADYKTGITVGIVRADGERAFVSDLGASHAYSGELVDRHWQAVQSAGMVCLVGINCLPNLTLAEIARLMQNARSAGVLTMLDTGWLTDNWQPSTLAGLRNALRHTSLVMPNLDEARVISGEHSTEAAARALHAFGAELVVIKLGAQGSLALCDGTFYTAPAYSVPVFDTVGAGDEFDAGFITTLRQGWDMPACLAFGNAAAACYVSRQVDRYPTFDEVLAAQKTFQPLGRPR